MTSWTPSRLLATGRHINIAPDRPGGDDLDLGEPELLVLDGDELSIDDLEPPEPECVPFMASRALFLPLASGQALRRVRFLALPLQMLRR